MRNTKTGLAILLSGLQRPPEADVKLEQYPTPGDIASELLWPNRNDIDGKTVIDMGCGGGILGLGAAMLGASRVTFIDSDTKAIDVARSNAKKLQDRGEPIGTLEFSKDDALTCTLPMVDIVVTNPPFGTRQKGADVRFVKRGLDIAPLVLSMHKTSTITFLKKWAKEHGANLSWTHDVKFPIKASMPHHRKPKQSVDVTLCTFERDDHKSSIADKLFRR